MNMCAFHGPEIIPFLVRPRTYQHPLIITVIIIMKSDFITAGKK